MQHEGVCQEANTARGDTSCCICLETPLKCCIFRTHKYRHCFKYFIVLPGCLAGNNFLGYLNHAIFGDQTIDKLSYNLFVVVK